MVALRRPDSPYSAARFPLRGLAADAQYQLKSLDTGIKTNLSGKELERVGLPVSLERRPDSAVVLYERLRP